MRREWGARPVAEAGKRKRSRGFRIRRSLRRGLRRAAWREGTQRLEEQPNVQLKLSGLGTFSHRVDPAFIAGVVRDCVAPFGSERCMFGSNFPVEKIWTDFATLWQSHIAALADVPQRDRDNILRDTAVRVYRL